ncbi:hypothetical protein GCM10027046_13320 [Uliginosibacterium flavum]
MFHDMSKGVHQAAQRVLATQFSEALRRRTPMPLMRFRTMEGDVTVLPFIAAQEVVMEWVCPETGRRIDVALLDAFGKPVLLIEVWHTHAVDIEKRRDLSPYWWIEVEASEVPNSSEVLTVRSHDNLPEQLSQQWEQFELFERGD